MTNLDQWELAKLSSPQSKVALQEVRFVILPCGSTEQHGPNLPLFTDTLIAEGLLKKIIGQLSKNKNFLILPTVCFGCSEEHLSFSGTISLRRYTFESLIMDIASSVARYGAKRLLLFNCHGGNDASLKAVVRDIRRETGIIPYLFNLYESKSLQRRSIPMDLHASCIETSFMLALHPELVRNKTVSSFNTANSRWQEKDLQLHVPWKAEELAPDGVIGNPEGASAELGEELITSVIEELLSLLGLRLNRKQNR